MSVRGDFLGSPHNINTTALLLLYLYFILGIIKYKKKDEKGNIATSPCGLVYALFSSRSSILS